MTVEDDVLDLYVFDRQLRLLVLDVLERVRNPSQRTTGSKALHVLPTGILPSP